MLALINLGLDPGIAGHIRGCEKDFFREVQLIVEKRRAEFKKDVSEAIYYANVSQKYTDPLAKKKKKATYFNGPRIYQEWQDKLVNIMVRVSRHISGFKKLTVFEWGDIKKFGARFILQKDYKRPVRKKINGQKIVFWEEKD